MKTMNENETKTILELVPEVGQLISGLYDAYWIGDRALCWVYVNRDAEEPYQIVYNEVALQDLRESMEYIQTCEIEDLFDMLLSEVYFQRKEWLDDFEDPPYDELVEIIHVYNPLVCVWGAKESGYQLKHLILNALGVEE